MHPRLSRLRVQMTRLKFRRKALSLQYRSLRTSPICLPSLPAIPRNLWTINRKGLTCVPSEKVQVAFVKIRTPRITCDIVGKVTRGKVTIDGRGQDIVVTMPIHATVQARDIGGILKQETATADARVRAIVRLSLDNRWNPQARVDIQYDWTDAPHIDILGQRIEFASQTDARLKSVVRKIEASLSREFARLNLRRDIARLWGKAFTSVQLNKSNPPVWMRITPQQLQFGGYSLRGKRLNLQLGMRATTETFVGDRPPDPEKIALTAFARLQEKPGKMLFFIPVIADYHQLEPVIMRALVKRSQRPFEVPALGQVKAKFSAVEAYGSTNGRIAVGVTFSVARTDGRLGEAQGQVWLSAKPVNRAGSREVSFTDLRISGDTDRAGTNLLLKIAASPTFSQTIADALAQNFERDYDDLMGKIQTAVSSSRQGNVLIRASIENVDTGELKAAGQGLYLPVWGTGTASVELSPA